MPVLVKRASFVRLGLSMPLVELSVKIQPETFGFELPTGITAQDIDYI